MSILKLETTTEIIQADRNHRWNNETMNETERLLIDLGQNERWRDPYEISADSILATPCPNLVKQIQKENLMQFMPELRQFLLKNGKIFTVRKFKMKSSLVYVETGERCKRVFLKQILAKDELEPYLKDSGFETLDAWWTKIEYHIPQQGPFYLYQVEILIADERLKHPKRP